MSVSDEWMHTIILQLLFLTRTQFKTAIYDRSSINTLYLHVAPFINPQLSLIITHQKYVRDSAL